MHTKDAINTLSAVLGTCRKLSNDEFYFKCPACDHRKHKLAVNLDKNAFHCWICDYRGRNIRRLVRRFGTFTQLQAWDRLSGQVDLTVFDSLFDSISVESEEILQLPVEFKSLANDKAPATGIAALSYLKNRDITKEDILKWKIGYCFSGQYENRIIIPSFNKDGDLNYFIARNYSDDYKKYKNPKASKNIIFNELYIDWNADLILVEGVFDAIRAGNAAPILGSTLRAESKLLRKIVQNDTPVYVALDPDAATKERKIIEMLLRYDIEAYKIDVSGYEDVGSMPKDVFEKRKNNANLIDRDDYLILDLLSAV
jgi:DNA primase